MRIQRTLTARQDNSHVAGWQPVPSRTPVHRPPCGLHVVGMNSRQKGLSGKRSIRRQSEQRVAVFGGPQLVCISVKLPEPDIRAAAAKVIRSSLSLSISSARCLLRH